MNDKTASLLKKALKFFFTSGIGFILDFCTYTLLTQGMGLGVLPANFLSSFVGVTFVFIVATHKIFENGKSSLSLPVKYGIYIVYQLLLIYLVSKLGDWINTLIQSYADIELFLHYSKLISKVLITPITMTCNFLVMRFLSERL